VAGRGFRLEAPRLTLRLALPTLFGRGTALRSIAIERPLLTLAPVPPPPPTAPTAPMEQSILVGDVRITQGTIVYKDPVGGDWRVDDVTLSGGIGEGSLV